MLSEVCGDVIGGISGNTDEEISVNEDNSGYNINLLADLIDDDEDQMCVCVFGLQLVVSYCQA